MSPNIGAGSRGAGARASAEKFPVGANGKKHRKIALLSQYLPYLYHV